jgi:DNA-binding XRE family transcriptional regulator
MKGDNMAEKEKRRKLFRYGMRLRGFSPGCQPKKGFVEACDDPTGKYYNIIVYSRRLTDKEIESYELDDLNRKVKNIAKYREIKGLKQSDLAELLGTSIKTVQSWDLRGVNTVGLGTCIKIADALGCNVRDLYDEN